MKFPGLSSHGWHGTGQKRFISFVARSIGRARSVPRAGGVVRTERTNGRESVGEGHQETPPLVAWRTARVLAFFEISAGLPSENVPYLYPSSKTHRGRPSLGGWTPNDDLTTTN